MQQTKTSKESVPAWCAHAAACIVFNPIHPSSCSCCKNVSPTIRLIRWHLFVWGWLPAYTVDMWWCNCCRPIFWMTMGQIICTPLQGFANSFVYAVKADSAIWSQCTPSGIKQSIGRFANRSGGGGTYSINESDAINNDLIIDDNESSDDEPPPKSPTTRSSRAL